MKKPLDTLTEIRAMMERSSRFISLSSLAGLLASIFALLGVVAVAWRFQLSLTLEGYQHKAMDVYSNPNHDFYIFIFAVALAALVSSIGVGIFFTTWRARKNGLASWDKTTQRVVWDMFIPLAAGGIFCLGLIMHNFFALVAPVTLLFSAWRY